ncbi:MAG: DUF3291 domain-containing protein [Paracoccaceae bacterium]
MIGQFNIARARWPLDDPRMAGFMNNVGRMNALARRSPGYIWRLEDEEGPDAPKFPGDPLMTFTLSVWKDVDSLRAFTWSTIHKRFRMRRDEWFQEFNGPCLVLWPVADEHRPTGAEALDMLDLLTREGPSEHVFGTEVLTPVQV